MVMWKFFPKNILADSEKCENGSLTPARTRKM